MRACFIASRTSRTSGRNLRIRVFAVRQRKTLPATTSLVSISIPAVLTTPSVSRILKFQNQIVDATTGSSLPFANIAAEIFMGGSGLVAGPNLLAPQSTPQSNQEIKYDGSKPRHSHMIRYGVSFNHIQGGGFASFFKNGPQIASADTKRRSDCGSGGPFSGGASNPLNYPADIVMISNGLGYSTVKPALGFPAGGLDR